MSMKNITGWRGIGPNRGRFVPVEHGLEHVLSECGITDFDPSAPCAEEFSEAVVDWYFSGNWVEYVEEENLL